MQKTMDRNPTRRLVESAVMIAVGTVLSMFQFSGPWALGGGITICSMLPLVIISFKYGWKWGTFTAFVYSVLQMILGIKNVQYADSAMMAAVIIMMDYIIAFSVIGLASMFKGKMKNMSAEVVCGIAVTFTLRFFCHFISGYFVWEALWPNTIGMTSVLYSLAYNASYMVPEIIITSVAAGLLVVPLKKYFA